MSLSFSLILYSKEHSDTIILLIKLIKKLASFYFGTPLKSLGMSPLSKSTYIFEVVVDNMNYNKNCQ